jgi:hypothetical protein
MPGFILYICTSVVESAPEKNNVNLNSQAVSQGHIKPLFIADNICKIILITGL